MRTLCLLLVLVTSVGCTGALRERTKQNRRERAAKKAPAWVARAKFNKEQGDAAYAQLLASSAKRAAGEELTVFYYLDLGQVADTFLAEAPAGTRREYLHDVHNHAMATSLGALTDRLGGALVKSAVPGMRIFSIQRGVGCLHGASWYETMMNCRVEADVFLWIRLEIRPANCPGGRGYHASARWTSAYQRQDFAFEIDFCRDAEEGGALLGGAIVPKIDLELRYLLPALAVLELLTPGYRYDWWLYKVDNSGGGSSFGGFD